MKLPETRRYHWLSLFFALVLALTMYPTTERAQIVGNLEADIPFQVQVGNVNLPPGKYNIHVLDNSDLAVMKITSADGSSSALFEVRNIAAKSAPGKT
jgi:soluble P-type ATPase